MALFAKKIDYCASPTSYLALLAIAKKKGGEPVSFIVYRYRFYDDESSGYQMRSFFTYEEAKIALFNRTLFLPTTAWLHQVASGGSYEQVPKGVWARVPVPRIGGRKRNKKPMQIGDLGYCYRVAQLELKTHESDLAYVNHEILSLEENFNDGAVVARVAFDELVIEEASLRESIDVARMRVNNLHCEMEYARSRRTGIPLSESSFTKMLLRAQEE